MLSFWATFTLILHFSAEKTCLPFLLSIFYFKNNLNSRRYPLYFLNLPPKALAMIRLYFFHAIIEVWNGAVLQSKHSDTHVIPINQGESVAYYLDDWTYKFQQRLLEANGREAASCRFVVTHASFIQDPTSFETIPDELGL